jgi:hypothetical protein
MRCSGHAGQVQGGLIRDPISQEIHGKGYLGRILEMLSISLLVRRMKIERRKSGQFHSASIQDSWKNPDKNRALDKVMKCKKSGRNELKSRAPVRSRIWWIKSVRGRREKEKA